MGVKGSWGVESIIESLREALRQSAAANPKYSTHKNAAGNLRGKRGLR